MSNGTYRKECIEHHEKNGDFVPLEDGLYVFFPDRESLGAMRAHHLRWIADELDRLNSNEVTNYDEIANLKRIIEKLKEEILGLQQMVEGYRHDNRELKRMLDKTPKLLVNLQLENMELRRKLWAAKLASHQPTSPIHPYTK